MKGHLTIYDEGVTETPGSNRKKSKYFKSKIDVKKTDPVPFLIPDGFIKIPNCSQYFINETGAVISIKTSNSKFLKPIVASANCHYVNIIGDNGDKIKLSVEKTAKFLFAKTI